MAQRQRTVLVTGGAKGIGEAIVRRFARAGYAVALTYRSSRERAEALTEELNAQGDACTAFKCDVADFEAVKRLYSDVCARFGFVDTLVNNAGVGRYKLFTEETDADYDAVMNVNLKGPFQLCRVFASDMISEKFGRIINVASVWGQTGAAMEVLYSASKAGVIGLTKALAHELAPSGVTVNAVSPGLIDTDMNAHLSKEELLAFTEEVPVGRAGRPEEIAAAALFLAGEDAGYLTGQVLGVNGGFLR